MDELFALSRCSSFIGCKKARLKPRVQLWLGMQRRGCAVAEILFENAGYPEHVFIAVRASGYLQTDGKSFGGVTDWHDRGRSPEEVEPLGKPHGIQVGE